MSRPAATLSLIAALTDNGVIGQSNQLPWHLPLDLKRFRSLTMGHFLIVGRKTYESIGRPLPGRRMVVVTRRRDFQAEGVQLAHSLEEAIHLCAGDGEIFVGGGEEIFRQALPLAARLYLTRISAILPGDAFFPRFEPDEWRLGWEEHHPADEKNPYACTFQIWERVDQTTFRTG